MPYCDNAHALSLDAETAEDGKTRLSNVLQNLGFDLHEEMSATSYFPTLGGSYGWEEWPCQNFTSEVLEFEACIWVCYNQNREL